MTRDTSLVTGDLTEVLSIPQAAERAKWSRWKMAAYLKKLNEDLGGMLLVNVSRGSRRPRWTVALGALKALHPQWFMDPEALQQQIDALREEQGEIGSRLTRVEKVQQMLVERVAASA